MKKYFYVLLSLSVSTSALAGISFCGFSDKDGDFKDYQTRFCNGKKLDEDKIAKEFNLTEDQVDEQFKKATFWGKGSSRSEILVNLDNATITSQARSDAEKKSAQALQATMKETDTIIAASTSKADKYEDAVEQQVPYAEYYESVLATAYADCKKNEGKGNKVCREQASQLAAVEAEKKQKDYENLQIENRKKAEEAALKLSAQKETLQESKDKFNQGYKKRFEQQAVALLNKVDGIEAKNLKGVEQVCFGETIPSAAKDPCAQIMADSEKYNRVNEQIDNQLKEIDEAKSPLDLLAMKLDNNLLRSKAARSEILAKAGSQLKGTVIGEMMDQMREDMCSLAQNPEMQCTGVVEARSAYINDAADILKETNTSDSQQNSTTGSGALKK